MTSLYGKVTDINSGEELMGASILLKNNGALSAATSTDFEGNYFFDIDSGDTYDITVNYTGYPENHFSNIKIAPDEQKELNLEMSFDY